MAEMTQRQWYLRRLGHLLGERSSWDAHWRDLNDYLLPRRARFNLGDRNQGKKLNSHIINSAPFIAVRTLAAGMHGGLTSPARPWFRLMTPDPALAKFGRVKNWLHFVEERLRWAFLQSNLYNFLPSMYLDLAIFGTAVGIVDEDLEDAVRGHVLPMGTFALALNARQAISTLYRETTRTYANLVEEFGENNVSENVRKQIARGNLDQVAQVVHVIEPQSDYRHNAIGFKGFPFVSCWMERAGNEDKFLRRSGYKTNPLIAVRWDVIDGDTYGRGPGMDCLGDAKALQHLEKKKLTLVDKLADPPMRAPASMRTQRTSLLPGDVNYVDAMAQGATFEPAMTVDSRGIQVAGAEILNHVQRIDQVMYADLWLMLQRTDQQMTAREIAERHEEKLLQLGPVLERLQDELLDPLIDRVFSILLDKGLIPEPPPELDGVDLRVDYISILAQAQKLLGVQGIERVTGFAIQLANGGKTEALDKLNADRTLDEYANLVGIKPDLINGDEEVAELRKVRAQQQQAQAQAEQMAQAAQGAKTLSETTTGDDNMLTRMLAGYGAPTGVA